MVKKTVIPMINKPIKKTELKTPLSFKTNVVMRLVKAINNDREGITTMEMVDKKNKYVQGKTFAKIDEEGNEDVFKETKLMIKQANLGAICSLAGAYFNSISINVLLHAYMTPKGTYVPCFPESVIMLRPTETLIRKLSWYNGGIDIEGRYLDRPIIYSSRLPHDLTGEPNSYVVFEVTSEIDMVLSKVAQLERDLSFLLCRERLKRRSAPVEIGNIVCLAGIACLGFRPEEVEQYIEDKVYHLPNVAQLMVLGRLALFDGNSVEDNVSVKEESVKEESVKGDEPKRLDESSDTESEEEQEEEEGKAEVEVQVTKVDAPASNNIKVKIEEMVMLLDINERLLNIFMQNGMTGEMVKQLDRIKELADSFHDLYGSFE